LEYASSWGAIQLVPFHKENLNEEIDDYNAGAGFPRRHYGRVIRAGHAEEGKYEKKQKEER